MLEHSRKFPSIAEPFASPSLDGRNAIHVADSGPTILRRPQVEMKTGLPKSSLYERIRAGTFPPPIRLGGTRSVGWVAAEVDAWVAAQIAKRDGPTVNRR